MELLDKLTILADAAKYDVACTSCGVSRSAEKGKLGATTNAGICHSFSADGRCITLLKVLMSNVCSYDCAYCVNRARNDVPRATLSPRELAELTMGFYRRNYIEGLFLSSGVLRTPDYTTERMCESIRLLREHYGFRGYIHAKAIPGTSDELLVRLGTLVDRMSVNIEFPSAHSLKMLAPEKNRASVLGSLRFIHDGIKENYQDKRLSTTKRTRFVPAGQSTQMIVGASPESDYHILNLSASLYRSFELRRVFFSAYVPVNENPLSPLVREAPLLREHRLYQADWLMRFYQFDVSEIIDEDHPFLDLLIDPKCNWALNHIDHFPIEINKASYDMLLRVPGIGVRGVQRVWAARRERRLDFDDLRRLNISLKRARHFITCNGRFSEGIVFDPSSIYRTLANDAHRRHCKGVTAGQLSLFEDYETGPQKAQEQTAPLVTAAMTVAACSRHMSGSCGAPGSLAENMGISTTVLAKNNTSATVTGFWEEEATRRRENTHAALIA
ncbi:MAG: putative DNA modification/repair radical SAM protein [Coriobacteriales bacterium]|jgi:putative DNA modification/repair radical SAM protein|nr:putative DNA modification/repair radical SAM protein [Coriobacteriales bacterium]